MPRRSVFPPELYTEKVAPEITALSGSDDVSNKKILLYKLSHLLEVLESEANQKQYPLLLLSSDLLPTESLSVDQLTPGYRDTAAWPSTLLFSGLGSG